MGKQLFKSLLASSLLVANILAGEMPDYVSNLIYNNEKLSSLYKKVGEPNITEQYIFQGSNSFVYDFNEIKVAEDKFENLSPRKQYNSLKETLEDYDKNYVNTPTVVGRKMLEEMREGLESEAKKCGVKAIVYDPSKHSMKLNDTLFVNAEVPQVYGVTVMKKKEFKRYVRSFFK